MLRFSRRVPKAYPRGDNHIDGAADEIGGQSGVTIIPALRPAVFERDILSLDVAGFAQSLTERSDKSRRRGARIAEVADHRHRLLLRAQEARNVTAAPLRPQQERMR